MNQHTRRLDRVLADAPAAATLLARLAASQHAARAIAPLCAQMIPGFDAKQPGACDLRGGVLRIRLQSPSQCSKLRQASARLLGALQRSGLEVYEIRLGVQPMKLLGSRSPKTPNTAGKTAHFRQGGDELDRQAIQIQAFAEKLALTLQDSELRRAVCRLGRRVERRLAQMRDSDQALEQKNREKGNTAADAEQE